ncbi:hypothetical protein SUNI508_04546 [Seiridium unicorne]|uniref:Uncharacterized protein n=1 Tax=Seiridium unicorne TaxID=138068 RepID=A0ABR2V8K5_9PEZI
MATAYKDVNFLSFWLGVLVHLGVFIRGEWHLQAPAIFVTHTGALSMLLTMEICSSTKVTVQGLLDAASPFMTYLLGLLGSITVYRLFFHRLQSVPGPRLAAFSKLWHVWKCRDSRGHHVLESWRKKYGNIVRTGQVPTPQLHIH